MAPSNPWETGENDGLISIGTHRLYASITGLDRTNPTTPLLIVIPGVGCSIAEWAGMRRLLRPFARTLLYERSGFGSSEESPPDAPPTAVRIAQELNLLLEALSLEPPYILVCHSYGGIISREFLHLRQQDNTLRDIAGMVFVDANQERNVELWPDPNLSALSQGLDMMEVTGQNDSVYLTESERTAMIEEYSSEKHQRTTAREMEHYVASCAVLAGKKQLELAPPLLGSVTPVSVLKGNAVADLEKIYAAGVARGNGTPEEREGCLRKLQAYREKDEEIQRGNLRLSGTSQFEFAAKDSGHGVHLMDPEAVVREVQWVLGRVSPSV